MNEYLEELGFKHYRFGAKAPHFDVSKNGRIYFHSLFKFSKKNPEIIYA